MEQRLGNSYRMTVNEKKFIEQALVSDLRVDGRRPFDYRRLTIKFGRLYSFFLILIPTRHKHGMCIYV